MTHMPADANVKAKSQQTVRPIFFRRKDSAPSTSASIHIAAPREINRVGSKTNRPGDRNRSVFTTPLELDLLRYFAENAGRVLSRTELLERVWKLRNYGNTRTVDNFMQAARAGADDFLSKPLNYDEIWMRLRVADPQSQNVQP